MSDLVLEMVDAISNGNIERVRVLHALNVPIPRGVMRIVIRNADAPMLRLLIEELELHPTNTDLKDVGTFLSDLNEVVPSADMLACVGILFRWKKNWQESNLWRQVHGTCAICFARDATRGFLHGASAHMCVCDRCAEQVMKTTRLCPMCRLPAACVVVIQ